MLSMAQKHLEGVRLRVEEEVRGLAGIFYRRNPDESPLPSKRRQKTIYVCDVNVKPEPGSGLS